MTKRRLKTSTKPSYNHIDLKLMVARQVYGNHITREIVELMCRNSSGNNHTYGIFRIGTLAPFIVIRSHPGSFKGFGGIKHYTDNMWYEIIYEHTSQTNSHTAQLSGSN